ncbi:phage tail length tape measure family protein [Niveispirillum sp. BGYR6]|uniref:phage tail length tape measure family protein n=1 Tax=Niveispirillum sp. BGYR6 TaxID=2971249 RepID=UPI0022B96E30|nr:phage tail length tape measure family protein [Niveispirillum sp. BGYR6]MDG5497422.1 phage tail length tape measure family protein [Niveispirillum sp. BGYR6]
MALRVEAELTLNDAGFTAAMKEAARQMQGLRDVAIEAGATMSRMASAQQEATQAMADSNRQTQEMARSMTDAVNALATASAAIAKLGADSQSGIGDSIGMLAQWTQIGVDVAGQTGGLTRHMNALSGALGRIGPVAGVAAGAVAAIAAAVIIGYKAFSDYHDSVQAVERANKMAAVSIGMTRSQLEQQASTAANQAGISIKAAREQQAAYIATGKIGGSVMSGLIGVSRNYALATGQDASAATASLARLFSDPAKGAQELSNSMGLLSDASLVTVQNLVAMGNETAAQNIILDALGQKVQGATTNLTALGRAGAAAAKMAGGMWDWLGEKVSSLVFNNATPDEKATEDMKDAAARMASAKAELTRLQQQGLTPTNSRLASAINQEYAQAQQDFQKHQATLTQIQQQAQAQRNQQEAEDKGRVAGALARELDTYAAQQKKLLEQKQKLEDGLNNGSGLADRGQVSAQLARVNGALGTMMTEQQKATKLQNAEAAAVNMTGLARDQYLARIRAEVETSGQLISTQDKQVKIQQAVTAVTIQHATAMANLKREQDLSVDAAIRMADAAGKGEAAQRAATYANEEAAASARSAQEASIIAAANKRKEIETARGIANEEIASLEQQTAANNALAAALEQGIDITKELAREEYQRVMISKLGKDATEDLARAMKAYDDKIASEDRLEGLRKQKAEADKLKEEAAQAAQEAERAAKEAIDKTASGLTDAIYDQLTGKDDSIVGWFKNLFKKISAEAIKTRIILPIVTSIVGSMPSLFGIAQPDAPAAATPNAGAGSSTANPSDLLKQSLNAGAFAQGNPFAGGAQMSVSSMLGLGLGSTASAAGAAGTQSPLSGLLEMANGGGLAKLVEGMDKMTAKLGDLFSGGLDGLFGKGGLSGGVVKLQESLFGKEGVSGLLGSGGTLFGSASAAAGVAGALGGIGSGMMAGQVLGMLGIGKGNSKGAAIGGALGGFAGSFAGPMGSLLGSIAGGAIGSLFGSKPSNKEGSAVIDLNSGNYQIGGFTGKKYSQENRDTAGSIADKVLSIKDALEKQLGAQIKGSIAVGAGSRDGLFATALNSSTRTSFDSSEAGMKQLISYVTQQFVTGIQDQLAPEISAALGRVDFSNMEKAGGDIDFITGFRDSLKSLKGDMGLADQATAQASAQVKEQVNAIRSFHDTAARLFPDAMGEVDSTLRSYVDGLIGVRDAAPAMTEVESAMAVLEAKWKAYIPLMTEVGYSTAQAQQLMADGLAKAKEGAKGDWMGGMDREFNSLIGNDYINKVRDLKTNRDTQYRNADALGADRAIVDRNTNAALKGVLENANLRPDQLQEAIRLFGTDFPEAASIAQGALDKLTGSVTDTGKAAANAAATKEALEGLKDRTAKADGSADTQAGALAIFDRARDRELESVRKRVEAGELGAEVLTETEKVLGAERVALAKSYADKAKAIDTGLADRQLAVDVAGKPDAEIQILANKQKAELNAARAAGYTEEQMTKLAKVLDGEMKLAVDKLAEATKAVNDGIEDRLFNATNDTNTKEGALAAFDRQATKDVETARRTPGADIDKLNTAIGLDRQKIVDQFKKKSDDIYAGLADRQLAVDVADKPDAEIQILARKQEAERAAAQAAGYTIDQMDKLAAVLGGEMKLAVDKLAKATKAVNDGIEDRLFNATNDTNTKEGALAAFDRQAKKDVETASQTPGADINKLNTAIGLDRQKIVDQFKKKSDDIYAGLADRQLAVDVAGKPDAEIQILARKQEAEKAAARAAGYTIDQMDKLAAVLGGEMKLAVDKLAEATKAVNDSIADRLFNAQTDTSTEAGAIAAFNRQADKQREEYIKTPGANITDYNTAIDLEREKIKQQFAEKNKAIADGFADRRFAVANDGAPDEQINALVRKQKAEIAAAEAAKYTVEQMTELKDVLGIELAHAIDQAKKAANQRIDDRLFNAQTDTNTLDGALAAFNRQAKKERDELEKIGGANLVDFDTGSELERKKIADQFKKKSDDIYAGFADRNFAVDVSGQKDEQLKLLKRKQEAEYEAAKAAGYSTDQLLKLSGVLAKEFSHAAKQAADAANLRIDDRLFSAQTDTNTLDGALAAFNRQAKKERDELEKIGGANLVDFDTGTDLERKKIADQFKKKSDDIYAGFADRNFAVDVSGQKDEQLKLLKRKQDAEYEAAKAAGYSTDQLLKLSGVLAKEFSHAAKQAADAANLRIDDRLFNAETDTNTLDGALAAFNRQAAKEREELEKISGANLVDFDKGSDLERKKIADQFKKKSDDIYAGFADRDFALSVSGKPDEQIQLLDRKQKAEYAAAEAAGYTTDQLAKLSAVLKGEMSQAMDQMAEAARQVNQNIDDRIFNATNDTSTREGALAAFDRQAARERVEVAKTLGADLVKLEEALGLERAAINKRFNDEQIKALNQVGGALRQWVNNVRATNATPAVNRDLARSQFEKQMTLAKGGNLDALQGLTDYAQRLIDAETPYTASGADRRAMVEAILSQIEALPAVQGYDKQILEQIKDLNNNLDIGDKVEGVGTEVKDAATGEKTNTDRVIQTIIGFQRWQDQVWWQQYQFLASFNGHLAAIHQNTADAAINLHVVQTIIGLQHWQDQVWWQQYQFLAGFAGHLEVIRQNTTDMAVRLATPPAGNDNAVVQTIIGLQQWQDQVWWQQYQFLAGFAGQLEAIRQNTTDMAMRLAAPPASNDNAVVQAIIGLQQWQDQVWGAQQQFQAGFAGQLDAIRQNTLDTAVRLAAPPVTPPASNDNAVVQAIINLQRWQDQVWGVQQQFHADDQAVFSKIRHNVAATAERLGGNFSYARGTDFHPGGMAMVGEEGPELVQLPRGSQVFTKAETLELARLSAKRPRLAEGKAGGGVDHDRLAASIDRQAQAVERQNALLEKIAANTADGADAAAQTAAIVTKPARVKVGTIAKLRRAG